MYPSFGIQFASLPSVSVFRGVCGKGEVEAVCEGFPDWFAECRGRRRRGRRVGKGECTRVCS